MNNADKFKEVFGMYATELWAMPEEKFVKWLNEEAHTNTISQQKAEEADYVSFITKTFKRE